MLIDLAANLRASQRQANDIIAVFFSIFELGSIVKHLISGPTGNSEFCFPSASMFPSALSWGTLRVWGKQISVFPLGPFIKCLMAQASVVTSFLCYHSYREIVLENCVGKELSLKAES